MSSCVLLIRAPAHPSRAALVSKNPGEAPPLHAGVLFCVSVECLEPNASSFSFIEQPQMTGQPKPSIAIVLRALEDAQRELVDYIEPTEVDGSAETTVNRLVHILEDRELLEAMSALGWTPPWLRPRKPDP
jgi:hypothetical protein